AGPGAAEGRGSGWGWGAGCPPTRCSPSGSACSCPPSGSRRCGAGSPASSATTATGGCGAGPGSSSWSPTGAPSAFARCWKRNTSAGPCPTAPSHPRRRPASATTSACTGSRTGVTTWAWRRTWAVPPAPSSRTSGTQLWQVADLAEEYGSGKIRTTPQQKLLILDVPGDRVADLTEELAARDLQVSPSAFRRGTMACTGIEFCKLAIVETKQRAQDLYAELDRRLPGFDTPISINVNGCPNSCARFQIADIGLKGSIVDGGEGFQVHLGGSLGTDPAFGRKLRGLKVTADGLADYVER